MSLGNPAASMKNTFEVPVWECLTAAKQRSGTFICHCRVALNVIRRRFDFVAGYKISHMATGDLLKIDRVRLHRDLSESFGMSLNLILSYTVI